MKQLSKALAVFINVCNYGVGIAVVLILIFKADFTSIFYISGMTTNESLFFNMLMFEAGPVLLGLVLYLLTKDYQPKSLVIEFPLVFEILPAIAAAICIFYGAGGETAREKIIVIVAAVVYAMLSLIVIYTGAAVFQTFPSEEGQEENEE